ncbi:MAG: hypothetical protein Fur0037_14590 [Planctomycetota bacterium]
MHHDTRDAVARAWSRRGFSCALWVDAPGQVWADFVHEADEVVHVLDGVLLFEVGGEAIRLEAGQELEIPAGTRHTVRNLGEGTSRWLYGYREESGIAPSSRA